MPYEILNF